jgi:hypothetical protein
MLIDIIIYEWDFSLSSKTRYVFVAFFDFFVACFHFHILESNYSILNAFWIYFISFIIFYLNLFIIRFKIYCISLLYGFWAKMPKFYFNFFQELLIAEQEQLSELNYAFYFLSIIFLCLTNRNINENYFVVFFLYFISLS